MLQHANFSKDDTLRSVTGYKAKLDTHSTSYVAFFGFWRVTLVVFRQRVG